MYDLEQTVYAKQDHFFADHVDRPVVIIKMQQQVTDWELPLHQHSKSQFIVMMSGLIRLETAQGIWMVPSKGALWIPAHTLHQVKSYGSSTGYVIFVEQESALQCPQYFQMYAVTDFLSALLERCSEIPHRYSKQQDQRLMQCVLEEILIAPHQTLHLPMPKDARLAMITQEILAHPEQQQRLEAWAKMSYMSERSLTRHFLAATNMSIVQWRQKLHIMLALQWLNESKTVQYIADRLGYDSDSTFIAMFKKHMKTTPKQYMMKN